MRRLDEQIVSTFIASTVSTICLEQTHPRLFPFLFFSSFKKEKTLNIRAH